MPISQCIFLFAKNLLFAKNCKSVFFAPVMFSDVNLFSFLVFVWCDFNVYLFFFAFICYPTSYLISIFYPVLIPMFFSLCDVTKVLFFSS